MKDRALFAIFVLLIGSVLVTPAFAAKPVQIEILFMNHGPLQPTLQKLDKVLSGYGGKVSVLRYDFESPEGERFMARKGLREHIPLMIWIDGKTTVPLNGKKITFSGFPTGSGPAFFQGKWTVDDLKKFLDQSVRKD